jgi:peptidoglycan/LPS O-acetylase OafA/YrhL
MSNAYEPETYRISRPTKVALVVAALVVAAEAVTIYLLTQTDDPFWPIAIFTTLVMTAFVLFLVYSIDAGLRDWRKRRRSAEQGESA